MEMVENVPLHQLKELNEVVPQNPREEYLNSNAIIRIDLVSSARRYSGQNEIPIANESAGEKSTSMSIGKDNADVGWGTGSRGDDEGVVLVQIVQFLQQVEEPATSFGKDFKHFHAGEEPMVVFIAPALKNPLTISLKRDPIFATWKKNSSNWHIGSNPQASGPHRSERGVVESGLQIVKAIASYEADFVSRYGYDTNQLNKFVLGMSIVLDNNSVRVAVDVRPDDLFEIRSVSLRAI